MFLALRACSEEVTAITSSPGKVEACKEIGADKVVVSSDPDAMKAASNSLASIYFGALSVKLLKLLTIGGRAKACLLVLSLLEPEFLASFDVLGCTQDLIINSVSATHEVQSYVDLLAINGTIVQLGLVTDNHAVNQLPLIFGRRCGPRYF